MTMAPFFETWLLRRHTTVCFKNDVPPKHHTFTFHNEKNASFSGGISRVRRPFSPRAAARTVSLEPGRTHADVPNSLTLAQRGSACPLVLRRTVRFTHMNKTFDLLRFFCPERVRVNKPPNPPRLLGGNAPAPTLVPGLEAALPLQRSLPTAPGGDPDLARSPANCCGWRGREIVGAD